MEKAARITLGASAAILAAYGAVFLIRPSVLGTLVGLEFATADAPVEIRAFYGGLELGMAAFLVACVRNPQLLSAGLLFCALAFSFAGAARMMGILEFGMAGPAHLVVGLLELGLAAWATWLKARLAGGPAADTLGRAA